MATIMKLKLSTVYGVIGRRGAKRRPQDFKGTIWRCDWCGKTATDRAALCVPVKAG